MTAATAPQQPAAYPRLVGDIGGTHARFAMVAAPGAPLSELRDLAVASHATLQDALHAYLHGSGSAIGPPKAAALGIATPVTGDTVRMTNLDWSFSIAQLRGELGLQQLLVLNDFEALALALPLLAPAELLQVGPGAALAGAPMGLLGAGTGLGVSALVQDRGTGTRPFALATEGGHVTLAAGDDRQEQAIALLRRRFGHASAERALSGPGIVNLYQAVCTLEGRRARALSPEEISAAALDGSDALCAAALELFFALLGNVAGNLALSLGARGGIFIGGGIVAATGERILASGFRAAFEAKGRFRDYLAAIPTFVIRAVESPALRGAARALELADGAA